MLSNLVNLVCMMIAICKAWNDFSFTPVFMKTGFANGYSLGQLNIVQMFIALLLQWRVTFDYAGFIPEQPSVRPPLIEGSLYIKTLIILRRYYVMNGM
jgi:hypothetical protein